MPQAGESIERTKYQLQAVLDFASQTLTVSETIHYLNATGQVLDRLLLVVDANWTPGILTIDRISWQDGSLAESWSLEGGFLFLDLAEPLQDGESLVLALDYELALPARPARLGFTFRQTNLGDWYAFVPPYRPGTGWLAYRPGLVGEYLAYDLADYEVELRIVNRGEGELVVAASALPERAGDLHRFRHTAARNFSLSISPQYQVFRQQVEGVQLASYAYAEVAAGGQGALQTAAAALELYNRLFGPYPHDSLSIVQSEFPDGLEYDGLVYIGQEYYWGYAGAGQNLLTIIAAHEIAHQWWYGLLGSDQAVEPWLDEAFATYSEVLFYEQVYGASQPLPVTPVADTFDDWWWSFRVEFYEPQDGFVGDTIYQYGSFRPYINAVYLRGALFFRDLRSLMGDQDFFEALGEYAARNRQTQVTAADFWELFSEFSETDLAPVRETYFGAP